MFSHTEQDKSTTQQEQQQNNTPVTDRVKGGIFLPNMTAGETWVKH